MLSDLRMFVALLMVACTALGVPADALRVNAWNIWRGGRENGVESGPKQVIDLMKQSRSDVILVQETYGSGELIAKGLGYQALYRGTNVSLYSRYPIEEDISVNEPFNCVGGIIKMPSGQRVAVYSIWLPYAADIWVPGVRAKTDLSQMLAACQPSERVLMQMLQQIDQRLSDQKYAKIPIIIGGDFNSMSHLDYTEVAREFYDRPVSWATSKAMTSAGYRDSFREANPVVDRAADRTWSPRFPEQEQDRIDFVYYRGLGLSTVRSERIDSFGPLFPSDHAAVVSEIRIDPQYKKPKTTQIQAATYNIRHGAGMDDRLDLTRSVNAIKALRSDIIALQEMDDRTNRTNKQNQTSLIAKQLNMHSAFGSFMAYDGGYYGLSILSKFPIVDTYPIRLPDGGEPRVALVADVRLPNSDVISVVNVHFDWLGNDANRFKQASLLAEALRKFKTPFILMGDFNDGPDSRTLKLFKTIAEEAIKKKGSSSTFPADKPTKEIDYIFAGPSSKWSLGTADVVPEKVASDHRPVRASLTLSN